MREGYTYDDEMPSSQGSYVNRERKKIKFTGKRIGTIEVDPVTKELIIKRDNDQKSKEDESSTKTRKDDGEGI